jgi:predicted PolB exonuclease-like 3'-5' exonuclease
MDTLKNFKNTLFIDIETVSGQGDFSQLSIKMQDFWVKKAKNLPNSINQNPNDLYFERAALYPEFGRIIVIGMGFLFANKQGEMSLKVKTIANSDEKELLKEFIGFVNKTYKSRELTLVAHNGKEFDFPYLCRRMLIQGLEIPKSLQLQGKKPWEIIHQDTMEMWKFGDRRSFASLELLAELLGIPGAKADLSGDRVNEVFYKEQDLARITAYCLEDVIVVAQLYLNFHFLPMVDSDNIEKLN